MRDAATAPRPSGRVVTLLVMLTVAVLLYMQAQRWGEDGFSQHGSAESGEARDQAYQQSTEWTINDHEDLTHAGQKELTHADHKELTHAGQKELTHADHKELTHADHEELPSIENAELGIKNYDVSLSPGNETLLVPHIPREMPVDGYPETPMSVLHKREFQRLPHWDFDDVYLRTEQPRQLTCPLSLWRSEDASFKKNFIPNINLFMYNRSVNMSEWNRLSHFNNPFGFMEYNHNEVKAALQHVPKPQEPLLVASGDGCVSCAVVGTAGILRGSGKGKEIDGHDYVFRMNGAITQGYEEDVGNRTSVYLHSAYSLTSARSYYKKYGLRGFPRGEGVKYVMIPERFGDFQWLQALFTGTLVPAGPYSHLRPSRYYSGRVDDGRFYLLHPDFLRYVRNRFLRSPGLDYEFWAVVRPSNGAVALFLALHTCDVVNAYGFITEDYRKYPYSYYKGVAQTTNFYFTHDFFTEMYAWKKLHNAGIINLYQRTDP